MIELALLLLGLGTTEFTVTLLDAATGKPVGEPDLRVTWDPSRQMDAAAILEMLASHPKVTLPRKLREDLTADPATWTTVQHSPGRRLLVDARQRLLAVPVRTDAAAGCAPLGYEGYEHSALPIRLRHP